MAVPLTWEGSRSVLSFMLSKLKVQACDFSFLMIALFSFLLNNLIFLPSAHTEVKMERLDNLNIFVLIFHIVT
jgi:hypothetical protein